MNTNTGLGLTSKDMLNICISYIHCTEIEIPNVSLNTLLASLNIRLRFHHCHSHSQISQGNGGWTTDYFLTCLVSGRYGKTTRFATDCVISRDIENILRRCWHFETLLPAWALTRLTMTWVYTTADNLNERFWLISWIIWGSWLPPPWGLPKVRFKFITRTGASRVASSLGVLIVHYITVWKQCSGTNRTITMTPKGYQKAI